MSDKITKARAEGERYGRQMGLCMAAEIAANYRRDASFDDSIVGHQEHQSNQWNISQAILAAASSLEEAIP